MSTNQFVVKNPGTGRLPSGFGRDQHNNKFHGGTIYNDSASGLIWVENQVSLGAKKILLARLGSRSGYGSTQLKKSPITTVIMASTFDCQEDVSEAKVSELKTIQSPVEGLRQHDGELDAFGR